MTNTVNQQPLAVSLQLTDFLLGWQGAQSPSTRKVTVSQLSTFYLPLTGGTVTGNTKFGSGAVPSIDNTAGNVRALQFTTAGSPRWQIDASNGAESGSNAGSDFELWSYTDGGSQLTKVLNITRATGLTNFSGPITVGGSQVSVGTDMGRNKINNGLFNIAQRGAGPFTSNTYTLDQWRLSTIGDSDSVTQNALADADRTAIGDEEAQSSLQNAFTGVNAAGNFSVVSNLIEDLYRLSNKTISVSFWAKASTSLNLGISVDQNFGTGGSPSPTINGNGVSVALTTSWQRFTPATNSGLAFALGSLSGKTIGTNGDHKTQLNFWFSSGTTNATRAGNIGIQSGTVQIWGVQLEVGSSATPLEKPSLMRQLAECQRYYQPAIVNLLGTGNAGHVVGVGTQILPLRATPSVAISTNSSTNLGALSLFANTNYQVAASASVTATGDFTLFAVLTASAEL